MKTKNKMLFSGHDHSELIQKLTACAMECESCASECLSGDFSMMAKCIEADRDCAAVCLLGATLLQRSSEIGHEFLIICERASRLCALECSKHDNDHCRRCTLVCQETADACHEHHGLVTLK